MQHIVVTLNIFIFQLFFQSSFQASQNLTKELSHKKINLIYIISNWIYVWRIIRHKPERVIKYIFFYPKMLLMILCIVEIESSNKNKKKTKIIITRFNTYRLLKTRLILIARIIAINYSRNMFIHNNS